MKAQILIAIGILFLLSTPFLSAQNALPNAQDYACWQSLASLQACQLEEYNREMDYAQRCTSYPEYQCLPANEGSAKTPEAAAEKANKQSNATSATASGSKVRPADADSSSR